jgi:hypothetical protein
MPKAHHSSPPDNEGSGSSRSNQVTPDSDEDSDNVEYDLQRDPDTGSIELKKIVHKPPPFTDNESLSPDELDDRSDLDELDGEPKKRKRGKRRESFEMYTPDEERAVLRKLDRRLVLFLALLYMLSFLDRSSMRYNFGT